LPDKTIASTTADIDIRYLIYKKHTTLRFDRPYVRHAVRGGAAVCATIAALCLVAVMGAAPAAFGVAPAISLRMDDAPPVEGMSLAGALATLSEWDNTADIVILGWYPATDELGTTVLEVPTEVDDNLLTIAKQQYVPSDGTDTVNLGLSADVPNIEGNSIRTATNQVAAAGFTLSRELNASNELVARQDPAPGTAFAVTTFPISRVTITVTGPTSPRPPTRVRVPDLSGLTGGEAVAAVDRAGLVADLEGGGYADYVTNQSPRAGTRVERGSTVTVEVRIRDEAANKSNVLSRFPPGVVGAIGGGILIVVLVVLFRGRRRRQTPAYERAGYESTPVRARKPPPRPKRADNTQTRTVHTVDVRRRALAPTVTVHDNHTP
jgi:hypothetical protein